MTQVEIDRLEEAVQELRNHVDGMLEQNGDGQRAQKF